LAVRIEDSYSNVASRYSIKPEEVSTTLKATIKIRSKIREPTINGILLLLKTYW
jgi:hypothetical protein